MENVVPDDSLTRQANSEASFWREVHDAYAEEEPAELKLERELWDATVADGLEREDW